MSRWWIITDENGNGRGAYSDGETAKLVYDAWPASDGLIEVVRASEADADKEALDLINKCLSAPSWSVSFLEDICEIVRSTGREAIPGAEWESH